MKRKKVPASGLFELRGPAYRRAVQRYLDAARHFYNPLGGEADDVDVLDVLPESAEEMRTVEDAFTRDANGRVRGGRVRVFKVPGRAGARALLVWRPGDLNYHVGCWVE